MVFLYTLQVLDLVGFFVHVSYLVEPSLGELVCSFGLRLVRALLLEQAVLLFQIDLKGGDRLLYGGTYLQLNMVWELPGLIVRVVALVAITRLGEGVAFMVCGGCGLAAVALLPESRRLD